MTYTNTAYKDRLLEMARRLSGYYAMTGQAPLYAHFLMASTAIKVQAEAVMHRNEVLYANEHPLVRKVIAENTERWLYDNGYISKLPKISNDAT